MRVDARHHRRGRSRSAGAAPRGSRAGTPAARRGTARPDARATPRPASRAGRRRPAPPARPNDADRGTGRLRIEPAVAQLARHRMDHADLERLARVERRQQARQPRRQHRLARAGRADHQQIVAAGRRDFERALGRLLALDVLRSRAWRAPSGNWRLGRRQHLAALEMIDQRDQRRRRQHLEPARPGRLAAAGRRADQPAPGRRPPSPPAARPRPRGCAPSSDSSPSAVKSAISSAGSTPIAASRPSAIGRS